MYPSFSFVHAESCWFLVDKARSEVVLVNGPSGDYVFAISTKNQQDSAWTNENEGYTLIRASQKFLPPEEP